MVKSLILLPFLEPSTTFFGPEPGCTGAGVALCCDPSMHFDFFNFGMVGSLLSLRTDTDSFHHSSYFVLISASESMDGIYKLAFPISLM